MNQRPLRVLVSAYACEPGKGSEPGVGWNWVLQISRFHEVWVITRANNREPIEKALGSRPLPNVHWVYFDLPRWARFWKRGQRGVHVYYYLWQLGAYFFVKRLHRAVGFDLVHHVTFGTSWFPTFLGLLPVPFVWGPVGAGLPAPKAFYGTFCSHGKVNESARRAVLAFSRIDPIRHRTENRAAAILAISPATVEQLKPANRAKALLFSQVGIDSEEMQSVSRANSDGGGPLRLLSVGRLVHWKGLALAVEAFARFREKWPNSEYWIIGSGPERAKLTRLASSKGVSAAVRFLGSLSREDYLQQLTQCDVFVYPSLHEPGAFVIAEAMAARRPVICMDLGEPASIVTRETGIKVSTISPEQAVRDLAAAMLCLAEDPGLRARLGSAGQQRVQQHFDWDKKGNLIAEIYKKVSKSPVPHQA